MENNFKLGNELEFSVYGFKIKGTFIKQEGSLIYIKTTEDFVTENVGEIQSINISHLKD